MTQNTVTETAFSKIIRWFISSGMPAFKILKEVEMFVIFGDCI